MAAADQELIKGRRAAQIGRRRIHRDGAKLEGVADRIVCQEGKDVRREVQHHEMSGVLLAHEPAGEEGKPGLHEEHQVARVEGPAEVSADPDVPHGISQLDRQRLFGCLVLVLVESLFLLRVVRIRLISWLRNNKGITGRVEGVRFVARGNAGGIRLWFFCGL